MPVSAWDLMSCVDCGRHYLGWNKYLLGWLSHSNMIVLSSGRLLTKLTSFRHKKGIKMIKIPHPEDNSHKRAYIIELAQSTGKSVEVHHEGILVYSVDTAITDGEGPLTVHCRTITEDDTIRRQNGFKCLAPVTEKDNLEITLGTHLLSVCILRKHTHAYTVQISLLPLSQK